LSRLSSRCIISAFLSLRHLVLIVIASSRLDCHCIISTQLSLHHLGLRGSGDRRCGHGVLGRKISEMRKSGDDR
jgi:hypothetical protein